MKEDFQGVRLEQLGKDLRLATELEVLGFAHVELGFELVWRAVLQSQGVDLTRPAVSNTYSEKYSTTRYPSPFFTSFPNSFRIILETDLSISVPIASRTLILTASFPSKLFEWKVMLNLLDLKL